MDPSGAPPRRSIGSSRAGASTPSCQNRVCWGPRARATVSQSFPNSICEGSCIRAGFKNALRNRGPDPQGLKPAFFVGLVGTAEAVPFHKPCRAAFGLVHLVRAVELRAKLLRSSLLWRIHSWCARFLAPEPGPGAVWKCRFLVLLTAQAHASGPRTGRWGPRSRGSGELGMTRQGA